jgi:hypothetical protein
VRAEHLRLRAVDVGRLDRDAAARAQAAGDVLEQLDRIRDVLEHVPQRDQVEAPGPGVPLFLQRPARRLEAVHPPRHLARVGRDLQALVGEPALLQGASEESIAAAEIEHLIPFAQRAQRKQLAHLTRRLLQPPTLLRRVVAVAAGAPLVALEVLLLVLGRRALACPPAAVGPDQPAQRAVERARHAEGRRLGDAGVPDRPGLPVRSGLDGGARARRFARIRQGAQPDEGAPQRGERIAGVQLVGAGHPLDELVARQPEQAQQAVFEMVARVAVGDASPRRFERNLARVRHAHH